MGKVLLMIFFKIILLSWLFISCSSSPAINYNLLLEDIFNLQILEETSAQTSMNQDDLLEIAKSFIEKENFVFTTMQSSTGSEKTDNLLQSSYVIRAGEKLANYILNSKKIETIPPQLLKIFENLFIFCKKERASLSRQIDRFLREEMAEEIENNFYNEDDVFFDTMVLEEEASFLMISGKQFTAAIDKIYGK